MACGNPPSFFHVCSGTGRRSYLVPHCIVRSEYMNRSHAIALPRRLRLDPGNPPSSTSPACHSMQAYERAKALSSASSSTLPSAIIPVPASSSLPVVASVSRHSESSFRQSIREFVKGRQCIRDVSPSAPTLNPPSARDRMSAHSRTASLTNISHRVLCIVCAMPSKFCTHYAPTYSKPGTPTSATSCVYGSSPPCHNGPRHHSLCQSNETFHSSPSFAQDIPVPFPIDPHFAQHAQPNLQYVRDVEVWQRFDFVIVRPNNVAKV